MKPMDFQEITAERILQIFKEENQRRVLLSDEVGLGKTIIARAVVKKVSDWHKDWDDHFKVIYVCSNINIANQNCRKLGIPEKDCLNFSEGRLSMQHLRLAEADGKGHSYQQLIPMTPATSFNMRNNAGTQYERALMYAILCNYEELSHYKTELNKLLKLEPSLVNWEANVRWYRDRVKACAKSNEKYLPEMMEQLGKAFNDDPDFYDVLLDTLINEDVWKLNRTFRRDIIVKFRKIFAQISLNHLDPDLVIMDEFQRFKELIDIEEKSEASLLANHFLKNENTKVLLLSATPYKPYSTLDEIADGDESHYEEFMRVINFLLSDSKKNAEFHEVWSDYSKHLSELRTDDFTALIASKEKAEDKMYGCMCRTERRNESIFDLSKASYVDGISENDVQSYVEIQTVMDTLGLGNFPVEYVKSAPYLLSFMNYKIKRDMEKELGADRKIPEIVKSKTLLLRRNEINSYEKIVSGNARLQALFDEAFGHGKNGAELLLWIPASRPYYRTNNVFSQNAGYTKTLVFSSWEMVPRMIAAMTSYEAERLVVERLPENVKRKSYFAEEVDNQKKKRSVSMRLRIETADLMKYPSSFLAELFNPIENMDKTLSEIRKSLEGKVNSKLKQLTREYNLEETRKSALLVCNLLKAMDGIHPETLTAIPSDVTDLLVDLAIGGPAVCALRIFKNSKDAQAVAEEFVSMFNKAESMAVIDALYPDEGFYYDAVSHYCAEGNLQAVLDEYAYILNCNGKELRQRMCEGFVDTASIPVETRESFLDSKDKSRIRCHFSVGYFNAKISEQSVQRTENIRNSFNSPFRPFVLATTSIGQEGLDFHNYSRKIMHWNLPSNPIDLEQREGRINRYMCHAIRQNIAENDKYNKDPFAFNVWKDLMSRAKADLKNDNSDLIPFWCLPDDYPYTRKIERIVPMYPYSLDENKYNRLISVLAIYRMTLGQPRQDELLETINKENIDNEDLSKLYMNLSPWSHKKQ